MNWEQAKVESNLSSVLLILFCKLLRRQPRSNSNEISAEVTINSFWDLLVVFRICSQVRCFSLQPRQQHKNEFSYQYSDCF